MTIHNNVKLAADEVGRLLAQGKSFRDAMDHARHRVGIVSAHAVARELEARKASR